MKAETSVRPRRALALAVVAIATTCCGPSIASGATVSATQTGPSAFQALHTAIRYEAAPGERNTVTVSLVAEEAEQIRIRVVDTSAPLSPGAGCTGGGDPGAEVICVFPKERSPTGCVRPGLCTDAGVTSSREVKLGDGDDTLSASLRPTDSFRVLGEDGADTIETAGGLDYVDPGAGADIVRTGEGNDTVNASPGAPDGADVLDLGGGSDSVRYSSASAPLSLTLNSVADDGHAGEGDNILAAEWLEGGKGDDRLIGASQPADSPLAFIDASERLEGGRGDDVVIGNGGPDDLDGDGGLLLTVGGGDDRVEGDAGRDFIDGSGGDDRLVGGGGNDRVFARGGKDRSTGGGGDDRIFGGDKVDRVRGGVGEDFIVGDTGADFLFAGAGDDVLDGGREGAAGADLLACGTGTDRAHTGPDDRVRGCERSVDPR